MPTPTPGAATYHANIALPAGADLQNRASFATPLEELADRTAYLRARCNGNAAEEFVYPATKTRTLIVTAAQAHVTSSEWLRSYSSGPVLVPNTAAALAVFPVDLPSGCTISGVDALVSSDSARSGTNRWAIKVYEQSEPWSSPAAPTATQQGSTSYAGTGSGYSLATVGSLTPFIRVAGYSAHVVVLAPTGSLGSNDKLYSVRITFDDGGPRNA